ncbi:mas-related G-protein coupled receptor member X1-like [Erinaceus europaeus]|uniref:Mas-related G-protein coupled receptor member X1-like n=1 Tax=Erinaceus europaeus TaxID=9365 RepID=A0A1S3AJJ6_ERIEU|nr:mas-related G-protein coupled receptor member X1-like [Erinaceus europaeus]
MNATGSPAPEVAGGGRGNGSHSADPEQGRFEDAYTDFVLLVVDVVSLLGLLGNGAVVWLLGFRVQRTPFSVYILNLACADFLFLLGSFSGGIIRVMARSSEKVGHLVYSVQLSSFLVGLCLLMAVSSERCVSVLCPLWYRCRRPAHLSSLVCGLTWALGAGSLVACLLCWISATFPCDPMFVAWGVTSVLTCLVLCASSLTLLLRVRCGSGRRRPGRLYLTIALSVLAFLLLGLPYGMWVIADGLLKVCSHSPALWLTLYLLQVLNSVANPLIYFFVGRRGQLRGRRPLREVLHRALAGEEEEEGGGGQGGGPRPPEPSWRQS